MCVCYRKIRRGRLTVNVICQNWEELFVCRLRAQENKSMLHFLLYDNIISDVIINSLSEVRLI